MKVYDLRKRCHNKAEGNDFYELDKRIMRAGASLQEFGKRLGRDRLIRDEIVHAISYLELENFLLQMVTFTEIHPVDGSLWRNNRKDPAKDAKQFIEKNKRLIVELEKILATEARDSSEPL